MVEPWGGGAASGTLLSTAGTERSDSGLRDDGTELA